MSKKRPPTGPPRRTARGQPKRMLHVFIEGKRTEDLYLTFWHRLHRETVSVHLDERIGVPSTLVDAAVDAKRQAEKDARKGKGSAPDEFWCVFDRDDHPSVAESIQRAEDNGIGVAFSNPCLELWFVLHVADQTAHIDRHAVQRLSKDLLGFAKSPSDRDVAGMADQYPDAKDRAQRLREKHVGDGSWQWENPGSSVWQLIDSIRHGA